MLIKAARPVHVKWQSQREYYWRKGQVLKSKPNQPNKPGVSFFPASESVRGVAVISILTCFSTPWPFTPHTAPKKTDASPGKA